MTKVSVEKIDLHLSHMCNLHCEQCTHLSNYRINKILSVQDVIDNFSPWVDKVDFRSIHLTGGEPLLNQNIIEIIEVLVPMFPKSDIWIDTNGLLLDKHPNLPEVLEKYKIRLYVTNHQTHNSDDYNKKFVKVQHTLYSWLLKYNLHIVTMGFNETFGTVSHISEDGRVGVVYLQNPNTPDSWKRFYRGYGREMKPYQDNDIQSSWDNCVVYKQCFQLLDGRIYKCAPLAYLPFLDEKFGLSSEWDYYLSYKPLTPDSSLKEIYEFFTREAESYCGMCPSKKQPFVSNHNPLKIENKDLIEMVDVTD